MTRQDLAVAVLNITVFMAVLSSLGESQTWRKVKRGIMGEVGEKAFKTAAEVLENVSLEDLYRVLEESDEKHKRLWEAIIEWKKANPPPL